MLRKITQTGLSSVCKLYTHREMNIVFFLRNILHYAGNNGDADLLLCNSCGIPTGYAVIIIFADE